MRVSMLVPLLGLLACRPTTPTLEPEPQQQPTVIAEPPVPVAEAPVEQLAPITPGVCPWEIGYAPTAFFNERVLIRLPVGLDDTNVVEAAPWLVQSSSKVEAIDCRQGSAGKAAITYAALTLQEDQPALSLEAARASAMTYFGYPNEYTVVEGHSDADTRQGMWVVEFPSSSGSPMRALVVLKSGSGFTAAAVFETTADAWPALVDSFIASGLRLFIVPG